jgi:type II secretory pathway component GspD/PulD (secretin)
VTSRLLAVLSVLTLAAVSSAEPPKREYRAAPATETQIACQIRVLTVRDDLFERVGLDFKPEEGLTDAQLHSLLEAAQGDPRSNVLQAPKVTTLDGQEVVVKATQQQLFATGLEATRVKGAVALVPKHTPVETGITLTLHGKASADRKTVTLRVNYKDVRVEGPVEMIPVTTKITPIFEGGSRGTPVPVTQYLQVPKVEALTVEKDLTISSGGHVLIAGPTRMQEERQEFGPPVLSKIPYVNRMYKNVGVARTTLRTYLIVSPLVLSVPVEPTTGR